LSTAFSVRSRLDPQHVVLGDVEFLELVPRGDCLCTRRPVVGLEEVSNEVDVATVRDPLESRHLVQGNVLPHEIAVRGVLAARGLFFSPAVQPGGVREDLCEALESPRCQGDSKSLEN